MLWRQSWLERLRKKAMAALSSLPSRGQARSYGLRHDALPIRRSGLAREASSAPNTSSRIYRNAMAIKLA